MASHLPWNCRSVSPCNLVTACKPALFGADVGRQEPRRRADRVRESRARERLCAVTGLVRPLYLAMCVRTATWLLASATHRLIFQLFPPADVALVEEKAASLSHLLRLAPELKLKVSALHGRKGSSELGKTRIAVCTPERASAVIDALIKTGSTGRLATVVVDEIHLVGEPGRGAVLESLLAKLLFASSAGGGGERSALQIVGMSATGAWRGRPRAVPG